MKKFLIYAIIFLSIFVGTATCVVYNGYSSYTKEQGNDSQTEDIIQESALSELATVVMNSESYSGTITIQDTNNQTYFDGNFSYLNAGSIAVQLELNGSVNDNSISADLTYLDGEVFLTVCGQKVYVSTSDLSTAVNTLLSSINTTSDSNFPKLDMEFAESLLSDITTTPYGNGYLLQLSLSNICDCFIKTNSNYVPTQILVTGLNLNDNTYTINILASQTHKDIQAPAKEEYLDASPILGYLPYAINTLTQKDLSVCGTLYLGDTKATVQAYFGNKNMIIGSLSFGQLSADFQLSDEYLIVNLYGTTFKLSYTEVLELINLYFPSANTSGLSINQLIDSICFSATIYKDKIVAINASVENINIDLEMGQTFSIPQQLDVSSTLTKKDLVTAIESFKNILSTTYSIDVTANFDDINLSGNAYLELSDSLTALNNLYFKGKLNGYELLLVYSNSGTTYLKFAENKIKLQNTSLEKTIEILLSFVNTNTISPSLNNITLANILSNLTLSGRKIDFNFNGVSATLTSNITSYKLQASFSSGNVSGTIFPNEKSYSRIKNDITASEFKSYDELPSLLTVIKNTTQKQNLHFSGNIDISILTIMTYKNISVDVTYDKNLNKTQITLSNLPTDSLITYLSNAHYHNHTCVITIQHDTISIVSTVKLQLTNRTINLTNKSFNLSEFKIDNLTDIFCIRQSIINLIKNNLSGESPDIVSNLTSDCIDVFKHNTLVNLKNFVPDVFTHLLVEFYYDTEITKATLHCNINSILFVNIVLKSE